ncbi:MULTISPECIES: hypothetical protein [unclassified Streptomyces]|uniref:hypothetical protein n=1 Tax=unclassified Streptomyces TaxID=2593676 RepID=UPI0033AEA2D1
MEWRAGRIGARAGSLLGALMVLAVVGAPGVRATAGTGPSGKAVAVDGGAVPAAPSVSDSPDLALVIAGDTGLTTTLHADQRDFGRLWRLLSPRYTGTEPVPEAWTRGRFPQVRATVIWGLTGVGGWPRTSRAPGGDVAIERQDQVFLAPDGTPWVRSDPSPDVADDDIRWHRAPRSVFGQLTEEGTLFGAAPTVVAAVAEPGTADRARWVLPGLAAGVVLGAGVPWLLRRAAARREDAGSPREPRQELIDL